jgi:hypothetical protein
MCSFGKKQHEKETNLEAVDAGAINTSINLTMIGTVEAQNG